MNASARDSEERVTPIDIASLQSQTIGELAGGIAHQLSTPLQAVAANLQFLAHAWAQVGPTLQAGRATSPGTDIGFLVDEVPQAIAQSLRSLEQAAALLHAMKESCPEASTTLDAIEPAKALNAALLLTQNRWRYTTTFHTETLGTLPTLRCRRLDLSALLTQLLLWLATDADAERRDDLHEIRVEGEAVDHHMSLTFGPLPPGVEDRGAAWQRLVALAQSMGGQLRSKLDEGRQGVTLRLPIVASSTPG